MTSWSRKQARIWPNLRLDICGLWRGTGNPEPNLVHYFRVFDDMNEGICKQACWIWWKQGSLIKIGDLFHGVVIYAKFYWTWLSGTFLAVLNFNVACRESVKDTSGLSFSPVFPRELPEKQLRHGPCLLFQWMLTYRVLFCRWRCCYKVVIASTYSWARLILKKHNYVPRICHPHQNQSWAALKKGLKSSPMVVRCSLRWQLKLYRGSPLADWIDVLRDAGQKYLAVQSPQKVLSKFRPIWVLD